MFILCMVPISAWADMACPAPPPYALLRQDEDYSYLRDAKCRRDFMDPIKFIPLSTQKDQYPTLGGEVRERYEAFQNANWGLGPQDKNGYLLQRISAYADWHFGDGIRLFDQLSSETEDGRNGGPRPTDEARLWVEEAFEFGSGRLVDVREGRMSGWHSMDSLRSSTAAPGTQQRSSPSRC
jgi:hypothetical protein